MGYSRFRFHMKMPAKARLADLFDGGEYEALPQPKVAQDPLKFRDSKKYADRLRDSRTKTEQKTRFLQVWASCKA